MTLCREACRYAKLEPDPRNEPPGPGDHGVNYGLRWMCRGRSPSHAYAVDDQHVGSCPGFKKVERRGL